MIPTDFRIIQKLTGNTVLIAKEQNPDDLNSEKQKNIDRLEKRDREVRIHEMVHAINPDVIKIGSAQLDYVIGPDGKAYATGGKQTVSTGSVRTPEEALSKAEALKKAAIAPGEPSAQDMQAFNAAISMEIEALSRIYSGNKNINKSSHSLLKGTGLNLYA